MAQWAHIEAEIPDMATRIRARFEGHPHHVLATIRRDGAPRVSGINIFFNDGCMWFGSMREALKASDVGRDPRVTIHSAPLSEQLDGGDAVVSGRARAIDASVVCGWRPESPADGLFFEVDIERLHLVEVVDEQLVVSMWDTSHGLRIVKKS